jgi:hypothetical protein
MTFVEVLLRQGIRFRRSSSDANEIRLCCPFCPDRGESPDTRFRLCINVGSGAGICHNCRWKSHRRAIFRYLHRKRIDAVDVEKALPEEAPPPTVFEMPKEFQPLTRIYDDLDRQVLRYLQCRGVSKKQIRKHRIGVCYSGRFAYRVVFPVRVEGKVRGIVARDFTGQQEPKYLNSSGEKYLYGFDPKSKVCVLSEGVFKALLIAQVTPHNSAALLGHDLTTSQLEQIQNSRCQEVILWTDPDRVGRQGTISIAEKLLEEWGGKVRVLWPINKPADDILCAEERRQVLSRLHNYSFTMRTQLSLMR